MKENIYAGVKLWQETLGGCNNVGGQLRELQYEKYEKRTLHKGVKRWQGKRQIQKYKNAKGLL